MSNEFLLETREIVKDFPGVRALDGVSFSLKQGEVHVLLGENGAGKSTLMKILAGAYRPDAGQILVNGQEVKLNNPKQAELNGISIIYQEFNLIPFLNVANNIFLGREHTKALGIIDHEKMHSRAKEILQFMDVSLDTRLMVHRMGVAQQQIVEIAKAISINARVLIMDEPTAALSKEQVEKLFAMIKRLKERGVSIVYISHRLEEVHRIGDRVTVLRDGKVVGTEELSKVSVDELIRMMIGQHVDAIFPRTFGEVKGEVALKVKGLAHKTFLQDINLEVRCGEIVGLAGLVGSGRTELAKTLFGALPYDKGLIEFFGNPIRHLNPTKAVRLGMGLLPEDRKEEGLNLGLPIRENIVLASLRKIFSRGILSQKRESKLVQHYVKELGIVTPSVNRPAKYLSGGNQQKVVLAKWLCGQARFLIFDEPTRGIDVGSKAEVHRLMNELVRAGAAILMISSELPELVNMSDRVYVMKTGRIVKEISREETTQEAVLKYAVGGEESEIFADRVDGAH